CYTNKDISETINWPNDQLAKSGDREGSVSGVNARKGSRVRKTNSPTPLHSVRATRTAGQKMRSRLLDVASALFKAHGLNGTSITAIAGASDAFPSQVRRCSSRPRVATCGLDEQRLTWLGKASD